MSTTEGVSLERKYMTVTIMELVESSTNNRKVLTNRS